MTKKKYHSLRLPRHCPFLKYTCEKVAEVCPADTLRAIRRRFAPPTPQGAKTKFLRSLGQSRLSSCMTALFIAILSVLSMDVGTLAGIEWLASPAEEGAEIRIKAINPGYTIDGVANVGEFIELVRASDESSISLTGYSLRYTNSSGKISNIIEFPEGSEMTGETILLRLASAPNSEQADLTYTKTLALEAGPLELVYQDKIIDSVCWKGKECLSKFSSADPTSIVQDLSKGEYSHVSDYTPAFSEDRKSYYSPPLEDEAFDGSDAVTEPQCRGLIFNEMLSYYENDKNEQFVEFFNPTDEVIRLDGCQVRYKKKYYLLSGMVDAGSFYVYNPTEFTLTKNPTSSNMIELIDVNEKVVDSMVYLHGQKKATAYALFGYDKNGAAVWKTTYKPTPGAENMEQEYRSCTEGKVLNEATGNCVKAATLKTAAAECPEGKYRNPLTGRCRKVEEDTSTECKEGYERNPETGRCRKIKDNSGAGYALVPETGGEKTVFVAMTAIGGLVALAVGYVGFQYRSEIRRIVKRRFKRDGGDSKLLDD